MIPAARLDGGVPAAKRPLFVLGGTEEFLVGTSLDALAATWPEDTERIAFDARADGFELRDVLDELRSPSLFGGARAVVLQAADKLADADKKTLARALDELPDTVPLVLVGAGLVPKGRRAAATGLAKAIAEAGGLVVRCDPPYDAPFGGRGPAWKSPLTDWVVARAAHHGLKMTPQTAHRLHRLAGTGLRELDAELGKLVLALGGATQVDEAALERHIGGGRLVPLFDAADALLRRDVRRTLGLVGALFDRGYEDASGRVVLDAHGVAAALGAVLRKRVSGLWRGAEARGRGVAIGEVAKVAGVPPFQAERLADEIDAWSRAGAVQDLLDACLELERAVKGGAPPRLAVERFCVSALRDVAGARS